MTDPHDRLGFAPPSHRGVNKHGVDLDLIGRPRWCQVDGRWCIVWRWNCHFRPGHGQLIRWDVQEWDVSFDLIAGWMVEKLGPELVFTDPDGNCLPKKAEGPRG